MTFPNYETAEAIDQAQAQVGADGKRQFETDHKFRVHLEAERIRIAEGRQPDKPVAPTLAGVTGIGDNGQRQYAPGHEPDPRMLELCKALSARVGTDGKRLADVDPEYRAAVDASFKDAIGGAKWSAASEKMLAGLQKEAKEQAADSGLFVGAEKQPGFTFDRTDPMFQSAATTARDAGLDDKQFGTMLAWFAKQQGADK